MNLEFYRNTWKKAMNSLEFYRKIFKVEMKDEKGGIL